MTSDTCTPPPKIYGQNTSRIAENPTPVLFGEDGSRLECRIQELGKAVQELEQRLSLFLTHHPRPQTDKPKDGHGGGSHGRRFIQIQAERVESIMVSVADLIDRIDL